eukprot:8118865-Pyramimonas_sp.AAC.1
MFRSGARTGREKNAVCLRLLRAARSGHLVTISRCQQALPELGRLFCFENLVILTIWDSTSIYVS